MATSFMDIGELSVDVTIRGEKVQVHGLSAENIFRLLVKYQSLREVFDKATRGADNKVQVESLALDRVMRDAPEAVYSGMASCLGVPMDDSRHADAIKRVSKMSISTQLRVLSVIYDITFDEGLGPFVQQMQALKSRFEEAEQGLSDTTLREPSPGSLMVDTPRNEHGRTHRVN